MLGAISRNAPGHDFTAFRNELFECIKIFIIDTQIGIGTEAAEFPAVKEFFSALSGVLHFSYFARFVLRDGLSFNRRGLSSYVVAAVSGAVFSAALVSSMASVGCGSGFSSGDGAAISFSMACMST